MSVGLNDGGVKLNSGFGATYVRLCVCFHQVSNVGNPIINHPQNCHKHKRVVFCLWLLPAVGIGWQGIDHPQTIGLWLSCPHYAHLLGMMHDESLRSHSLNRISTCVSAICGILWIHSAKDQNRSDNCATLANPKTVATRPNLWRFLMFFFLKFHCNPMVVPRNPWVQDLCPGLMAQVATMIPWWRNSTSRPHTCGMRVARTGGWWLAMECWSEMEWWPDGTPCFCGENSCCF